jgi:hypothetical protein
VRETHASQCSKSGATKECSDSEIRRAQMHGAVEASMAWKIDLGYICLAAGFLHQMCTLCKSRQTESTDGRAGHNWGMKFSRSLLSIHPSIPSFRNLDTERQVSGLVHTCLCMASGRRQATNKPSMTCRKRPCRYFLNHSPPSVKGGEECQCSAKCLQHYY